MFGLRKLNTLLLYSHT